VSGSLANRLVEAADRVIADAETWKDVRVDPEQREPIVRAVVAVVLMELARSGQVAWSDSLAALAGVVEGGEQT
jgi:hypothetical protein